MSRRQGMFGNAKISDKVFKDLPVTVARGVQKDLQYVLKKDEPQDILQWNRAVPTLDSIDTRASIEIDHDIRTMLSRKRPRNSRDDEASYGVSRKTEFRTAKEVLKERENTHSSVVEESLYFAVKRTRYDHGREHTTTVFKSPPKPKKSESDERQFPSSIDPQQLADRILIGLPHLPLRNSDDTTYSQAVKDILLKAMNPYFEATENSSLLRSREFESPSRSFMNRTAPLNLSRSTIIASQCTESPASILSEIRREIAGSICGEETQITHDLNDTSFNISSGYTIHNETQALSDVSDISSQSYQHHTLTDLSPAFPNVSNSTFPDESHAFSDIRSAFNQVPEPSQKPFFNFNDTFGDSHSDDDNTKPSFLF